jgi:hypothetical protein
LIRHFRPVMEERIDRHQAALKQAAE